MAAFVASLLGFVNGLWACQVPVLGCSMLALMLGLWTLFAVGNFVMNKLHDIKE